MRFQQRLAVYLRIRVRVNRFLTNKVLNKMMPNVNISQNLSSRFLNRALILRLFFGHSAHQRRIYNLVSCKRHSFKQNGGIVFVQVVKLLMQLELQRRYKIRNSIPPLANTSFCIQLGFKILFGETFQKIQFHQSFLSMLRCPPVQNQQFQFPLFVKGSTGL